MANVSRLSVTGFSCALHFSVQSWSEIWFASSLYVQYTVFIEIFLVVVWQTCDVSICQAFHTDFVPLSEGDVHVIDVSHPINIFV